MMRNIACWVAVAGGMVACASRAGEDVLLTTAPTSHGSSVASTIVSALAGAVVPAPTVVTTDPSTSLEEESSASGGEDDPAEMQRGFLEDGELTSEEYEAAFNAFMDCANVGGARVEIRRVDPESGQILYTMWDEGKEIADECYWQYFSEVDLWFQTTNSVLVAREEAEHRAEWRDYVLPCLERFGVTVPAHLDGTELTRENPEALPFHRQYSEHLMAGTCE